MVSIDGKEEFMSPMRPNPFREYRAEQMGPDLWKMYVPGPFGGLLTSHPLVLEGGRGSGKTMIFLCNSWKQQVRSAAASGRSLFSLVNPPEFLGIYYKVDTGFVTSMRGGDQENWIGVFNTYLGVSIIRELLEFLQLASTKGLVNEPDLVGAMTQLSGSVGSGDTVASVRKGISFCDSVLDAVEKVVNGPSGAAAVQGTVAGRLVSSFVNRLLGVPQLSNARFRIFIDEYETLLEYQQRVVNTLIKHSDTTVVYNIGMRPKGMKTQLTLSDTEIIQDPHDYRLFRIEFILDPEDDKDYKELYLGLLREISRRRFDKIAESMGQRVENDVEFYLGRYDVDSEIARIIDSRAEPPFLGRLVDVIRRYADAGDPAQATKLLAEEPSPLLARLHLCLLLRHERYRPSLQNLISEYQSYKQGVVGRYSEWLNNTKLGLVFLLAHEYKKEKLYYGFDVFTMLSSGVVRYFLELCERSFDFALMDGFSWSMPRGISPEEQTSAARFVSRYKIRDITGYAPYGRELRTFVQGLGLVFENLHHNPNTTLGEPEPNHFCADDFSISERSKEILNSAVMWAVLQDRQPTKQKASLPKEMVDYHLNHIYCPYYGISYRSKRKIELSRDQLEGLLAGDQPQVGEAIDEILHREKKGEEHNSNERATPVKMTMELEKGK